LIIAALAIRSCPSYLLKLVQSFLTNRTAVFSVQNATFSKSVSLGCPQGGEGYSHLSYGTFWSMTYSGFLLTSPSISLLTPITSLLSLVTKIRPWPLAISKLSVMLLGCGSTPESCP
jgi:hypothetical protein